MEEMPQHLEKFFDYFFVSNYCLASHNMLPMGGGGGRGDSMGFSLFKNYFLQLKKMALPNINNVDI